jgi:hypothetical protein
MPAPSGTYFYQDSCAGIVRSFRYQNGQPTEQTEWPLLSPPGRLVTSFGEHAACLLYVMTQRDGMFTSIPIFCTEARPSKGGLPFDLTNLYNWHSEPLD